MQAAKLKEEGNALFIAKKYRGAEAKHTTTINPSENAILYASRAACHLALEA